MLKKNAWQTLTQKHTEISQQEKKLPATFTEMILAVPRESECGGGQALTVQELLNARLRLTLMFVLPQPIFHHTQFLTPTSFVHHRLIDDETYLCLAPPSTSLTTSSHA